MRWTRAAPEIGRLYFVRPVGDKGKGSIHRICDIGGSKIEDYAEEKYPEGEAGWWVSGWPSGWCESAAGQPDLPWGDKVIPGLRFEFYGPIAEPPDA